MKKETKLVIKPVDKLNKQVKVIEQEYRINKEQITSLLNNEQRLIGQYQLLQRQIKDLNA